MGDKLNEARGMVVESLITTASEYTANAGKEVVKKIGIEGAKHLTADFAIDAGASLIPGVGNMLNSIRYNRKFNRIEKMYQYLSTRVDELTENLSTLSDDEKGKLDDIAEVMYEKVSRTIQEEKIEYMVDGFLFLSRHEELSFDIAYMYYDMLDRLTLLDIGVLRFYSTLGLEGTYEDVLTEFGVTYEQYNSVRENLSRYGLIQSQVDQYELEDLVKIEKIINNMQDSISNVVLFLNSKAKKAKPYKKDRLKLKSKEKLKISKFGREFLSFFINE
ncbi:hypothetical protein VV27_14470 [Listeria monocytogenes]|nr:hypothetical protein [Listeria monocytogenes]EAC9862505.1 hypothetical protein [Listeria monocytogenes]EAD0294080.1 hypothetical protein [Listeria monocytogenes]EAD4555878.1 hypothetical protein [Listeria monocytogenes]EKB1221292.1 hypothetical protein [Listeria monocytogenes]